VDALRAGDELRYHPGEANLRLADVAITHGPMPFGAGTVAAREAGAGDLVDLRSPRRSSEGRQAKET